MEAIYYPAEAQRDYLPGQFGRLAAVVGPARPLELMEFPVPAPAPGAMVVRIARANICGSDLHVWRGELDYHRFGRAMRRAQGHEGVGTVFALGQGVAVDALGQPISVGDRVAFRYFFPCGRCRLCLKGLTRACPNSRLPQRLTCEHWPHFKG